MGSTIVKLRAGSEPRGTPVVSHDEELLFEDVSAKVFQDRVISDLRRILDQLDRHQLWLAGIHLSSAIDAIQREPVVGRLPPEA
jgi:hypothetical protein